MQRSHRQTRSAQSANLDRAAQVGRVSWAIASAHKVYTALALSFLLSSVVSAVHPKAGVRMLAANVSFSIGGAWIATCLGNARIQGLQLEKGKMLAEANQVAASQDRREAEIVERQRALTSAQTELEAARTRLKTFEESYKVKADAAATKAAQLEASKRVTEAERVARRQVAEAEKRLNNAIKDADALVKRMQAELDQGIKAAEFEAAAKVLVIQTESESAIALASEKVATAEAAAQKAKEDSRIAIKEFSEQMELSRAEAQQSKQASVDKVMAIKVKAQQQEVGAHKYKETVHQVLDDERSKVNGRVQSLSSELARVTSELSAQKNLITRLTGPKFFNQSSLEGQVGNRIMSFLVGRKVMVSGVKIGETKYGEATFYFEPLNCDLKEVEDQLEALHLHAALGDIPTVSIEDDGTIKMVVRINSDRKPKASVIKRVSDRQLRQAFLDIPFGLRFTGYTGRGKSTLMNNVIDLYEQEMGTRFTIFDPKVDFPSVDYPKNKVYRGLEKCINNIDLIGDTVKARQDYKVLNDEQGTVIPAQHLAPRLFLIDECKDIHDAAALADLDLPARDREYVKKFRFSIQKGLEVGRGLLVRVVYSTVTPDSSDFGFKNSVFKQSATVFLGDQCYEALGSKSQYLTTVSDIKKAQLRQEYDARIASDDDHDQFVALFFNGLTNEVFFFSPPKPQAWMPQSSKPDFKPSAQVSAQPSESKEMAVNTVPTIAQPFEESAQNQPSSESSPALGQNSPEAGLVIPSLAEVLEDGANCPYCNAHSRVFKAKTPRKSDSTVRLICKTKACSSRGIFRAKVSDS